MPSLVGVQVREALRAEKKQVHPVLPVDDLLKSEVPEGLSGQFGTPEHSKALEDRYQREVGPSHWHELQYLRDSSKWW